MEKCPNTLDITILGKNESEKCAILFNPRCKQWDCPYCGDINKEYWVHQAARGTLIITSEKRDVQFVTLTSRGYCTPYSSIHFLRQNWPKLNRKLKYHTDKYARHFGLQWAYFMVPEHHRSGVAHFHLLAATLYDTEASWKDFAYGAGFGYIVDVQPLINPQQAANYVAKYLTKMEGNHQWPKGFMRVRHSANWPIAHDQVLDNWVWEPYRNENTVWIEKMALIDMGWQVVDKREDK